MISSMPLISVIVPVFNCEVHIEETVKSIQQQTFANLEIILVDDASTDNSYQICKNLASEDGRIVLCKLNVNLGVSGARNKGMSVANGAYIGFVDADDYLDKDYYELLHKVLERTGSDMAKTGIAVEYPNKSEMVGKFSSQSVVTQSEVLTHFLQGTISRSACTALFAKEYLTDLRFEEGRAFNEDVYFTFQAILKAKKIFLDGSCRYHYRKRVGSASTKDFQPKKLDILYYSKKICEQTIEFYPEYRTLAQKYYSLSYLHVFRQILKSPNYQQYKVELRKLVNELLVSQYYSPESLSPSKRIELWCIRNTAPLYRFFLKTYTTLKQYIIWKGNGMR